MPKASRPYHTEESAIQQSTDEAPESQVKSIEIPQSITIRELAILLQVDAIQIIKQLMRNSIMANINQAIAYEAAAAVVTEYGYEAHLKPQKMRRSASAVAKIKKLEGEEAGNQQQRPPIITVMGHVNHGKTRLLDVIRETNVMDSEAGGITQHIGAYQVTIDEHKLTFLDTPGHEAFTAMRAHGAQITDIVILVVAADDGVMPQTVEAINHAKAAGVPILVAINKIDKANANPELVKQQLADNGLVIEEWGGDTIYAQISAKEKLGIPKLLENLLLMAEMEDLKANPSLPAAGVVIEAEMDKTRGPLATVLIQTGTLKIGDITVVGTTWGRVRALFNDKGKRVRKAEPSTPIEILGLSIVPHVGDPLAVVADERKAQALIENYKLEIQEGLAVKSVNLNTLHDQISAGRVKELNIILKTDVQGSIEPIRTSLGQLGMDEVKTRVIHSGTGNVTESDVMLAIASGGLIIGFGVSAGEGAKKLAATKGVDIRHYDVIYSLTDDVEKALKGMLEPVEVEVIEGRAEVRAIFSGGKGRKVAGSYVTEGKVSRNSLVRLRRKETVVIESTVSSLKRFKDDIKEVATGYECGVGIKDFDKFQVGDMLEFFRIEKSKQ